MGKYYRGHNPWGNNRAIDRRRKIDALGGSAPPTPPAGSVELLDGGAGFGFADDTTQNIYLTDTDGDLSAGYGGLVTSSAAAVPVESSGGYFFADDGA